MTEAAVSLSPEAFRATLKSHAAAAEAALDRLLPAEGGAPGEAELAAAMRYATLGPGKRLRAFLALETGRLFGAEGEGPLRVAAAVECLHAYSLVHDDLPSMDDDDLRRGRPTVHKVWPEATAILAGDALQTLAFEILADPATHHEPGIRAELCLRLARASGAAGMVGGQALDLAAEAAGARLDAAAVKRLQTLKTGALIAFAAEGGAIVAGARADDVGRIGRYAAALGEAFQIADDLLDVTGTESETGKRVGKDQDAGKATFVDILGVDGARARAEALVAVAAEELAPFGELAAQLLAASEFVVARKS
ncbi:MAG: polyprenyl synthetase family protein [Paracoccaceae bacterium]